MEYIIFSLLSFFTIVSAIFVITKKNVVISAISLVANMICLSFIYFTLNAQFIASIQVLVYAGAIMVLFLFVIMLLNLGEKSILQNKTKIIIGVFLSIVFLSQIIFTIYSQTNTIKNLSPKSIEIGKAETIGKLLFSEYLLPFEITSFLLLVAIVGAVVLAKKKLQ